MVHIFPPANHRRRRRRGAIIFQIAKQSRLYLLVGKIEREKESMALNNEADTEATAAAAAISDRLSTVASPLQLSKQTTKWALFAF